MTVASPKKPGVDAFHKERSRCIDSFALLEEAVLRLLEQTDTNYGQESFGQKLELLKKSKANTRISAKRLTELKSKIEDCTLLAAIRNDIVHSRLQIAEIENEHRACFTNTRECMANSQCARLFTLEGLRSLTAKVKEVAEELSRF